MATETGISTNAKIDNSTTNPSVSAGTKSRGDRKRVPLSVPTRKLEVPEIPGFHCHWFLESNVPNALQAWYEFVNDREVPVNQRGVGTDTEISGNADLGSHIRIVASRDLQPGGEPEYLVLMKLPIDLWNEDRQLLDNKNADIMRAIFVDEKVMGAEKVSPKDQAQAYVSKAEVTNVPLLNRKPKKVV